MSLDTPTAQPLRRRRPARVGQPAVDRSELPHRARRRPPAPVADTRTIERALFVTGNPKRDQLLGAAGWTTKDRMRHDPLGVLTGGASPEELDRALRVARTIVNALARAGLPTIAVRDTESADDGARPRGVARERRRPGAPEPPL